MTQNMETPAPGADRDGRDKTAHPGQAALDLHSTSPGFLEPTEALRAALALAELGLRPIPLNPSLLPARKGWTAATNNPCDVTALFCGVWSVGGVAIVTGGGVGVLDLDRNHADGADGVAEFSRLLGDRPFPKGPRWRTKRGGMQILLTFPAATPLRNLSGKTSLAPGVEFKGDNGSARVPPTPKYRWIVSPWDAPIPDAPDWIVDLVRRRPAEPLAAPSPKRWTGAYNPYIAKALASEVGAVARAGPGARTMPLFVAACRLGRFVAGGELRRGDVISALTDAARANGLLAFDGETVVRQHIVNGLAKGAAAPRTTPAKRGCAR